VFQGWRSYFLITVGEGGAAKHPLDVAKASHIIGKKIPGSLATLRLRSFLHIPLGFVSGLIASKSRVFYTKEPLASIGYINTGVAAIGAFTHAVKIGMP